MESSLVFYFGLSIGVVTRSSTGLFFSFSKFFRNQWVIIGLSLEFRGLFLFCVANSVGAKFVFALPWSPLSHLLVKHFPVEGKEASFQKAAASRS